MKTVHGKNMSETYFVAPNCLPLNFLLSLCPGQKAVFLSFFRKYMNLVNL